MLHRCQRRTNERVGEIRLIVIKSPPVNCASSSRVLLRLPTEGQPMNWIFEVGRVVLIVIGALGAVCNPAFLPLGVGTGVVPASTGQGRGVGDEVDRPDRREQTRRAPSLGLLPTAWWFGPALCYWPARGRQTQQLRPPAYFAGQLRPNRSCRDSKDYVIVFLRQDTRASPLQDPAHRVPQRSGTPSRDRV